MIISKKYFKYFAYLGSFALIFITVLLSVKTGFCISNYDDIWKGTHKGISWDLTAYKNKIFEFYSIFTNISTALSSVTIAAAGFKMFGGTEKAYEAGKKIIKVALIAIAVIYFVPPVITEGIKLAYDTRWLM